LSQVSVRGATHNLVEVVRHLDPTDQFLLREESLKVLRALRESLCTYYAVYDLLEKHTGLSGELTAGETAERGNVRPKLRVVSAYATFAAASQFVHATDSLIPQGRREELADCTVPADYFIFGQGRDEDLKSALSKYYTALAEAGDQDVPVFTDPLDAVSYTRSFLMALCEQARATGEGCAPDLLACVADVTFRIDDLELTGWDTAADRPAARVAFRPVTPQEVVGNEEAKKRLLRYADRLALYDPTVGRNPLLELGGLPWSVFLDGPPGTGKTSLFRLYLTRLSERTEAIGLPLQYEFIDPGVKDEYYGRTARLLTEKLGVAHRRDGVFPLFFDDLDLLLLGDRNSPNVVGADKDILNLTMQHLDGIHTVPVGNSQTLAATNQPLGTDDALRQRFQDRLPVDGPVTAEHFAQLQRVKLQHATDLGMVAVASRDSGRAVSAEVAEGAGEQPPVEAIFRSLNLKLRGRPCWEDLGALCAELKREYPGFSGRTLENALQTLRVQSADFDVPEEWFESPEAFRAQPFERRVELLRDLFQAITGDMIARELYHHFEIERRYADQQADSDRRQVLNRLIRQYEAEEEFRRTLGKRGRNGE